ncbi:MAG TPA: glycerol-3-phosphate 1-O-acyltransferase PlsY [Acholeplasmataceae bacterium]|jgi:glycerol-3-phosphate acyltransferase PlsY|nr:glycerol-3-phosphate 1-O-acyltransferase PlsY [Acholeplasmataceae bacterium]
MGYIAQIGLLIASYLLGSIPWGFVFGKLKGIDIREHGSKNIGATNTGRILGQRYAIYTYILDMVKGALFVFLFRFGIIPIRYCLFGEPLLYGLTAALGHTFPIYLRFRGGKAVATGGGVIFGYCPWLLLAGLAVFFLTTFISKYVSLGSLVSATFVLLVTIVLAIIGSDPFIPDFKYSFTLPVITAVIYIIIIVRHKANIQRIIHKSESKVNWHLRKKHEE